MRNKKIIKFVCPECRQGDLVLAQYPVTVREHFTGLNTETGKLEYSRVSYGADSGLEEEYFECMSCDYRPQLEGEDITTEEDMAGWLLEANFVEKHKSSMERKNLVESLITEGHSYTKIGKILSISRQRVYQIHHDYPSIPRVKKEPTCRCNFSAHLVRTLP